LHILEGFFSAMGQSLYKQAKVGEIAAPIKLLRALVLAQLWIGSISAQKVSGPQITLEHIGITKICVAYLCVILE
jgi:hypothetical protein